MTTKFDIGDRAFTLLGDKIEEVVIVQIHDRQTHPRQLRWAIETLENHAEKKGMWFRSEFYSSKLESELFKTKEELIASL